VLSTVRTTIGDDRDFLRSLAETTFMGQTGGAPVTRSLYRRAGDRNGPVVDPVALRVGAIDGVWLPGTARDIAFLLQQGTSGHLP
jgi:hypothetical protein